MKTILLTFDIEEFPTGEFNNPVSLDEAFKLGYKGTTNILKVLKDNNIKATLFVTYEFADRYKKLIKELEDIGCEIGSHGYSHEHRYKNMSSEEALKLLTKTFKELKKLGFKVNGFRAPQMNTPGYEVTKAAGFKYDSSLHPTWIPGHYNNFFKSRKIKEINSFKVVPLSVTPLIRAPMGWIWFRNFGLVYEKIVTKLNFINSNFANIYIHSWETVDLSKLKGKVPSPWLRNTGEEFIETLDNYIKWCKKRGYQFSTISEYIKL